MHTNRISVEHPLLPPSYWMFNLGDGWLLYLRAEWFHYVCLIRVYWCNIFSAFLISIHIGITSSVGGAPSAYGFPNEREKERNKAINLCAHEEFSSALHLRSISKASLCRWNKCGHLNSYFWLGKWEGWIEREDMKKEGVVSFPMNQIKRPVFIYFK